MRPRRLSGASARPLNFTVRVRNKIRICSESDKDEEPRLRPPLEVAGARAGGVQGGE
jgi:hypothetical protein